jgi:hypothetical protein
MTDANLADLGRVHQAIDNARERQESSYAG